MGCLKILLVYQYLPKKGELILKAINSHEFKEIIKANQMGNLPN